MTVWGENRQEDFKNILRDLKRRLLSAKRIEPQDLGRTQNVQQQLSNPNTPSKEPEKEPEVLKSKKRALSEESEEKDEAEERMQHPVEEAHEIRDENFEEEEERRPRRERRPRSSTQNKRKRVWSCSRGR